MKSETGLGFQFSGALSRLSACRWQFHGLLAFAGLSRRRSLAATQCPLAPAAAGRRMASSYHISGDLGQRDEPPLQRQLQDAGEIEKNNRQTAAAVERQIAELQKTIVSHEVDLSRSISINGLDEHTTRAVMTFRDRLSRGEDLKTAALGIAGYELPEIEAAMAQRDRDEMRALDALLMRPTWRRRVVLWLLGGRPT